MARRHVMTPARKAALRKAQMASARKRRGRGKRIYGKAANRPTGISGLARTTTPYLRVNKRSQTVGFNSGTIIPFTGKRVAFGSYLRLESTTKHTATDKAISRLGGESKVGKFIRNNVSVSTPAVRLNLGGTQARLGTSRGAGPTVILRRGSHKTPQRISQRGLKKYETRMRTIKKKKARPQRRKKK